MPLRPDPPPPELVGRDEELAGITVALREGADAAVVLALTGEPGIGKTALLAATRALAVGHGYRVLRCAGFEVETHFPFSALYELLEPVLDHVDGLPAGQRDGLLAAFGMAEGAQPEPFLIATAVLGVLAAAAAGQPVAVLVDDAQWLDPPSGDCLALVARRLIGASVRVCLIATVRVESEQRLPAFLSAAVPRRWEVGGLGERAAEVLLDRSAPGLSGADRRRVRQQARGNPLALMELPTTRQGPASDPDVLTLSDRLARDFGGRCAALPQPVRDALLIAALDDRSDEEEILAAGTLLAGRPLRRTDLGPACEAGLVLPPDGRVTFRHPLMRSGILRTERLSRRQAAHTALAEVVDAPYRRAWHRAQSIVGPDDAIADQLEATVEASLRRGAVTTAISSLERAAELSGSSARRGRRLLKAAEHAFALGRSELVDRLLGEAAGTELDELDWARMEWLREIFNDGVPGDAVRVRQLCEIAGRSAAADDVDLALNLLLGAALRCWWADTGPAARALVVESVAALGVGDDPRAVAAVAVAEPVLQAAAATAALALLPVAAVADVDAIRMLGLAAHAIGDSVRADDYLTVAEGALRTQQRLGVLAHALSMHVIVLLELGHWDRAAVASAEAVALAGETGQPIWTTGSLVCEAQALALRGRAEEALELVARVELAAHRSRLNDLLSCAGLARGMALLTTGADEDAYDALRRLFDPDDPSYHPRESFGGLMYLAEAAARTGRTADAAEVVRALEAVAAVTPAPILHVHLGYARAVLAPAAMAEHFFRQALADPEIPRWPWVRARTELAFGCRLRDRGRSTEAAGLLGAALATFDGIGAAHWAGQARTALEGAGG